MKIFGRDVKKCGTKKNNNHSGITTPIRSTTMTTGNVCLLLRFYIQKIVNKYNIFEQKQNITYIYKNQYKIWTIIVEKEFFNSNLQIKNI